MQSGLRQLKTSKIRGLTFVLVIAIIGVAYILFSHASNGWSSWESLGGSTQSAPTAVSWGTNRVDLFTRGSNNAIYNNSWNGSSWSGWKSLGGLTYDAPAASSWGSGRLDLFIRATNNTIQHMYYQNGKWSKWENLGGATLSAPAAVSWGSGRIDLFIRGTDNAVKHEYFANGIWSGWVDNLGGATYSAPTVSSWGSGRLDLFVRGTNNVVYHQYFSNNAWSGWIDSINGGLVTSSAPAAVSSGLGKIDVFARGADNAIYQSTWNGSGWSPWQNLGGVANDAPAASSWGAGRLDLFIRGTDNAIYRKYYGSGITTTLLASQQLTPGQSLQSPNGNYKLTLQSDGNLVVFNMANQTSSQSIWSNSASGTTPASLALQSDCNLVEYNTAGQAVWRTWTDGLGNGCSLMMQDDGNVVIYDASSQAVWSSQVGFVHTTLTLGQVLASGRFIESQNGLYRLVVQSDGNVVAYNNLTGVAIWQNAATNKNPAYPPGLEVQPDGNLFEYNSNGNTLWQSHTDGSGSGNYLIMGNDGNVILYNASKQLVWSSQGGVADTTLLPGHSLYPGQYIESQNGQYRLYLQTDGNVVVYNSSNQAIWNSGSFGNTPEELNMDTDGNLREWNTTGQVIWNSHTDGSGVGNYLTMQNDGNLVLYNQKAQPVWDTFSGILNTTLNTNVALSPGQYIESENGQYRFYLQTDGNVVTYNTSNQVIWAGYTGYGQSPSSLIMQGDGNLVEYNTAGQWIWQSVTGGSGSGNYLVMQDDGDLVMYTADGTPVWSSTTGVISLSTVAPADTFEAYPGTIQSNAKSVLKGTPPTGLAGWSCYVNGVFVGAESSTGTYVTTALPAGTNTYQMACSNYQKQIGWIRSVTVTILSSRPSTTGSGGSGTLAFPPSNPGQVVGCTIAVANGCSSNGTYWIKVGGASPWGDPAAPGENLNSLTTGAPMGVMLDDQVTCPATQSLVPFTIQDYTVNSTVCEQEWVNYYKSVGAPFVYADLSGFTGCGTNINQSFPGAITLYEWYPALGCSPTSVLAGAQGYLVQRYFAGLPRNPDGTVNENGAPIISGTSYANFPTLWNSAAAASHNGSVAWW